MLCYILCMQFCKCQIFVWGGILSLVSDLSKFVIVNRCQIYVYFSENFLQFVVDKWVKHELLEIFIFILVAEGANLFPQFLLFEFVYFLATNSFLKPFLFAVCKISSYSLLYPLSFKGIFIFDKS